MKRSKSWLTNPDHIFSMYYLWKAEKFQETYRDSAFPTEERFKRRKCEVAAGVQAHLYKETYNRKRVHDPKAASRYNKRRNVEELWEDYGDTWIARWDTKPCGCVHCSYAMPGLRQKQVHHHPQVMSRHLTIVSILSHCDFVMQV